MKTEEIAMLEKGDKIKFIKWAWGYKNGKVLYNDKEEKKLYIKIYFDYFGLCSTTQVYEYSDYHLNDII
jgi:hypothetical protein